MLLVIKVKTDIGGATIIGHVLKVKNNSFY